MKTLEERVELLERQYIHLQKENNYLLERFYALTRIRAEERETNDKTKIHTTREI